MAPVNSSAAWRIAPYFIVADVRASANYYHDKLGFEYERLWGEPPAFCMVWRGGVCIMLSQFEEPTAMNPNGRELPEEERPWDAYLWIDDADALLAEFRAKGVTIARDICDQPYGNRDFDILDCNGYCLCFGHDISSKSAT